MKKKLWIAALVLALLLAAVGVYAGDFYRAAEPALAALEEGKSVSVVQEGDLTIFSPESPSVGFVFYPGGKVEDVSYAPLLRALAEEGTLCVLTEMPLNLAVLDMAAAEGIPERFPAVETWYIGGHSLGGSMAASYGAANNEAFRGLVLLAAYSTADLSDSGLNVLSIYGDRDQVLNLEKYGQYRSNLPETTVETVLSGGNHAQFGSYGPQEGDGPAAISPQEQLDATVSLLLDFMKD